MRSLIIRALGATAIGAVLFTVAVVSKAEDRSALPASTTYSEGGIKACTDCPVKPG